MKMKLMFAAIAAALGASAAHAAPLDPTTTTPTITYYISGASAQKVAVGVVVPADLFATPADVVKLTGSNGSTGWLGMSNAAVTTTAGSVSMLVLYNSTNGSAAGINQLLSTAATPTEAESKNIKLPDASCTATAGGPGTWNSTCSSSVATETDMALSDVQIGEFAPGVLNSGAGFLNLTQVGGQTTGLEAFGVIVNKNLYSALQIENVAEGLLSNACLPTYPNIVTGIACQPSIRRADYGTIATKNGAFSGAEALALMPSTAALQGKHVTLCRRDDFSGTQAASNIFFLNSVCGRAGFGGALTVATDGDNTAGLGVVASANNGTGAAETCVKTANGNANDFALGVVSLGEADEADTSYDGTKGYYFVALDGVSPNKNPATGVLDVKHRENMRNANYTFATDMSAITRNSQAGDAASLSAKVIASLKDSGQHNLVGIGYLDIPLNWPSGDSQNVKFDRQGNNCSPLH